MDPIIDARLKGIEEKLGKNQELLLRIRRTQKHGQYFKVFYWIVIIMLAFGSFYFIQPYLAQLISAYSGGDGSGDNTNLKNSIPNLNNINELIKQFKGAQQ